MFGSADFSPPHFEFGSISNLDPRSHGFRAFEPWVRCPPVEIRQCTCDAVRGVGSPAQCPQARRPRQQCLLWYFSRAGFAGVSPRAQVTSGWYLGAGSLLCWNGLSARPRAPSKGPGQTGADGQEPPAAGALGKVREVSKVAFSLPAEQMPQKGQRLWTRVEWSRDVWRGRGSGFHGGRRGSCRVVLSFSY